MEENNLKLWNQVEKTNPEYTKKANVKGNSITSIAPQYQIKNATEHFGVYGDKWGFRDIQIDYTLVDKTGLVFWKAEFYHPTGSFPATNSISIWRDNAMTKPDDQFAKKVETDSLTKCLSKLGFNADVFLGLFDDVRYVEDVKKEFAPIFNVNDAFLTELEKKTFNQAVDECVKNKLNEEQKALVLPVLVKLVKSRSDLVKIHGVMNADQRTEYEEDLKSLGSKYPKK